ncbi:MAG: hypothetical protein ACOC1K_06510 [Nanoarchaeota archaeon]
MEHGKKSNDDGFYNYLYEGTVPVQKTITKQILNAPIKVNIRINFDRLKQ